MGRMASTRFSLLCLLAACLVLRTECVSHIVKKTCLQLCDGTVGNKSEVARHCPGEEFSIQGRCCINGTETVSSNTSTAAVLGIDLSNCGLSNLNNTLLPFYNLMQVILVDNNLKPADVNQDDFYGLSNIVYLTLPEKIPCPGGNDSWLETFYSANETKCLMELDICKVNNFTCPDNSYCVHRGPGLKNCLCMPGFHGYKCLHSGTFPTMKFVWGLGGGTLGLAAILWFTQRRHAGAHKRD